MAGQLLMEWISDQPSTQRIALLKLNNPKARNALNREIRDRLAEAFEELAADDTVKAVIITGDETAFAAGADLKEFQTMGAPDLDAEHINLCWKRAAAFPKPLIACVQGFALGGGCELAMLADIIIAGKSARFGLPEIKVGIMPGAGGVVRLVRAVGKVKASQLLLTGEFIDAEKADAWGLVSEVVNDEDCLERSISIAKTISAMPPRACQYIKDVLQQSADMPLDAALKLERRATQILFATKDKEEGMNAFFERRAPSYDGN